VEDTFALPTGMAASIALEESIALGNKPWKKETTSIKTMFLDTFFFIFLITNYYNKEDAV
jgi:hypothetical protein